MKLILKYILKLLARFTKLINSLINKAEMLLTEDTLSLITTSRNTLGRNINFVLSNSKLLEKEKLFFQIYQYLMSNEDFLEFGKRKVIMVNGKIKNETFNLHHNVLIENETTFEDYWDNIKDILGERYEDGYAIEGIPMIEINV